MGGLSKTALLISAFLGVITINGWSSRLDKKVSKEITKTFQTTQYQLQQLNIPDDIDHGLSVSLNAGLRSIEGTSDRLGYAYVGSAPSKTAEFDYLVIFDTGLEIIHAKVLIYREDYGGEIGSKRWLKQFYGKGGGDHVSADTNIDAISGATISVRSMTRSMDKLLHSIGVLQEKEIL